MCFKYEVQIVLYRFLFRFLSTVVEMLYGSYVRYEHHVQNDMCYSGVSSREIICMFFGQSSVWASWKLLHWDFFRYHKSNKCQTLHDGTICRALPVHYTFSDLDIISNSFNWQFYVLIHLSQIFVRLFSTSRRSWIYHYLLLSYTDSREITDVFPDLTKTLSLAFPRTLYEWGFSNFGWLYPCLGSTNSYRVWWPWPCFKVINVSESLLQIAF